MPLLFSPRPSPLLLSLPSTSTSKPQSQYRLRPVYASSSPSPELLGKSALRRISEKLRSLGYLETSPKTDAPSPSSNEAAGPSPGEIFLPTPAQLPRHRVGSTLDPSWAAGDGEAGPAARLRRRRRRARDAAAAGASAPPSAAELTLPRDELRRLQSIGIRVRKRLKIGKAGVTEGIVNGIHERWRNAEVVKIKCEDVWALNMRRTHEILEAIAEKEKAEKLLEELEKASRPSKAETRETISEEERYMLRKVGLKMNQFLLLGRRGVFDGTIENMHLHWKYRELVKIICKEHSLEDVEYAARTLEAESGGILVAVEKVSKGHAIIVYRGKNYQRPSNLRPKTLLTKRDALKRSLEYQRCKSLKLHVLNLSKNIEYLKKMKSSYYNQGMDDLGVNSRALQQKNEEEPEVAPKCDKQEAGECASVETDRTLNFIKSGVHLDDMQEKSQTCFDEPKFDLSVTANQCLTWSSSAASSSDLTRHQNQLSSTMTSSSDVHSKGKGETKDVDEPNLDVESAPHLPFRPRSLSNQERLVLRKQALQMKKRPVLSIGRNNVITGVAKTIKTHFKKHPLAIVNIKNRADGTPIQQLISDLEEATGSVLVSKEINTVILYRGWGADAAQTGSTENSSMAVEEREVISPQLLEAIRLECGLLPAESE